MQKLIFFLVFSFVCSTALAFPDFTGDADYLNCGTDDSLDITDTISVSFWTEPDVTNKTQIMLSKRESSNYPYVVRHSTTAQTRLKWDKNAGSDSTATSAADYFAANTLVYVGITDDGTGTSNVNLYKDTVADSGNPHDVSDGLSASGGRFSIGSQFTSSQTHYWDGMIGAIYIWDSVQTTAVLDVIFNSKMARIGLNWSPTAYFPLDDQPEGVGTLNDLVFKEMMNGSLNQCTGIDADGDSDVSHADLVLTYP